MRSIISLVLVTIIFTLSLNTAFAKPQLLSTTSVIATQQSFADRQSIANFMKEERVQKELIKLGVDPKEAASRVATLSDTEVQKLSEQIEKARAGGDAGVGSILGVALFVFVILLITDILGVTKVFPFTRSVR